MALELESQEVRIVRLEERQKVHERDIGAALKVAEAAQEVAMETKEAVAQVNQAVAAMPQKIIEAIDKRGGNRWSVANQWLVVLVAVASPFIAKWLGL
jgi:ABC-type hemin transport system substrate-binding protein